MHKPRLFPSLRTLLLGMALTASFGTASLAQNEVEAIDLKKGKWEELVAYIGTYDYDAVLDNKLVKAELDALLKGHTVDLKKEFEVVAPIGFERDCLVLKGNRAGKSDMFRAYIEACIVQGSINLATYEDGQINVYTKLGEYKYLSDGLRQWVFFQNQSVNMEDKPDNVELKIAK